MPKTETVEIQKELHEEGGKIGKYQSLILGCNSLPFLFKYEMIIGLTSWVPGALGLLLRSKLYPSLMGSVGRNVTFGTGVVLRHPKKIHIGDHVVVDDNVVLDAKGTDNRGIFIDDGVFLGRNTILNCKNGDIILDQNVNIGFNSMIFSASSVRVGANNLIAGYTYLVGGTHHFEDPTIPVLHQGRESKGITIGPGGWLGAHVNIFDGVTVGKHVVIGANSAVNKDIPDYAIAAGAPVKVIKERKVKDCERIKPAITVAVVSYNSSKVIAETVQSILDQDYPEITEIMVVDNHSTDGCRELIASQFSTVHVIDMGDNRGPNPPRNAALRQAQTDWVLLMDDDIVLAKDAITELEKAVHRNPDIGIASAQIRFAHKPDQIQYNGAHIHYVGGAVMNHLNTERPVTCEAVPAGTMLVDRKKAETIGLFDEDFFYGWADGDFSFRMTIAGYPCVNVARAKVYHKKEKKGMPWIRFQVRNRWWFMLKTYNTRTLIVTMPMILLNQLAIMGFCAMKGQLGNFIKGSLDVWGSLPSVFRKRKQVMAFKKLKDKQTLSGKNIDLLGDTGGSGLVKLAGAGLNGIFSFYWFFTKRLIK